MGLYKLNVESHFKGGKKSACAFGNEFTDNGAHFGLAMCNDGVFNKCGKVDCEAFQHTQEDESTVVTSNLSVHKPAMETIEEIKSKFTSRDQKTAEQVCRFQHVSGHPSDATLEY